VTEYEKKSYGRNEEVDTIFHYFNADRDILMAAPRRLGKSFVLDRMVQGGGSRGWVAVKIEVAGCSEPRTFFRRLCHEVGGKRSGGQNAIDWIMQRLGQVVAPRSDSPGQWYTPLISLDHETYFERLVKTLNDDPERRWALLIDELPIFLKAMHDQGEQGVYAARNFMNLTSRLRAGCPRVRWLITGSVGLEPLARAGGYMGVLAKFERFHLQPLSKEQAKDFVQDLAKEGRLRNRTAISDPEANALLDAVGWRAAYYLEALAMKLSGEPCDDEKKAQQLVDVAVGLLLQPGESGAFGIWEEHLSKHYSGTERKVAFAVLAALAPMAQGLSLDALLAAASHADLTRARLREILRRLEVEGFVTVSDWDVDDATAAFRNPLLRRWWVRFPPQATA
jgi:uncharacterized protein